MPRTRTEGKVMASGPGGRMRRSRPAERTIAAEISWRRGRALIACQRETDSPVGFVGARAVPVGQLRSQRRHERILESALRVFSQKGYREAVVDDIAAEAATSKGGIYFHFPTKQAIFLALLDRTAALLRSKVETAIASEPDPLVRAELALGVVLE